MPLSSSGTRFVAATRRRRSAHRRRSRAPHAEVICLRPGGADVDPGRLAALGRGRRRRSDGFDRPGPGSRPKTRRRRSARWRRSRKGAVVISLSPGGADAHPRRLAPHSVADVNVIEAASFVLDQVGHCRRRRRSARWWRSRSVGSRSTPTGVPARPGGVDADPRRLHRHPCRGCDGGERQGRGRKRQKQVLGPPHFVIPLPPLLFGGWEPSIRLCWVAESRVADG